MSANITNMDLTSTATKQIDRDVEIANLEFRVVEAAVRWCGRLYTPVLAARPNTSTSIEFIPNREVDDAVRALIAAREKQ